MVSPIKVKSDKYTSESSIVRLIKFMKMDLKILRGSCRQNEMQQITKKQAAIATEDILSLRHMNRAIKNHEIEKIKRCIIRG